MNLHEDQRHDEDRLLDHSYDGIQEYDNPLPGWWKWVFWASIGYAVLYVMYYEVGVGTSVMDDFDLQRAAFFSAQEAQFADLEINEATIAELSTRPDLMAAMRKRFESNCSTCHAADASGLAGPNLTDEFWIHGGTRMEIYKTIRDGVRGKAMQAWLDRFGPAGVLTMSAYIDSIRGTNRPGPRGPEGKQLDPDDLIFSVEPAAPPATTDPPAPPGPAVEE